MRKSHLGFAKFSLWVTSPASTSWSTLYAEALHLHHLPGYLHKLVLPLPNHLFFRLRHVSLRGPSASKDLSPALSQQGSWRTWTIPRVAQCMAENRGLPLGAGMQLNSKVFSRGGGKVGNISILLLKLPLLNSPSHYRQKDGGKQLCPGQPFSMMHLSQSQQNTQSNHNCVLCLNTNMLAFQFSHFLEFFWKKIVGRNIFL